MRKKNINYGKVKKSNNRFFTKELSKDPNWVFGSIDNFTSLNDAYIPAGAEKLMSANNKDMPHLYLDEIHCFTLNNTCKFTNYVGPTNVFHVNRIDTMISSIIKINNAVDGIRVRCSYNNKIVYIISNEFSDNDTCNDIFSFRIMVFYPQEGLVSTNILVFKKINNKYIYRNLLENSKTYKSLYLIDSQN